MISVAGAAYLFSVNGPLITTFTNPAPAADDYFGFSIAAVGTDRVLIGTIAGAAYLFNTNGALLTSFTNPTPKVFSLFGGSVAAVGTDRVLIGAPGDYAGVSSAGAAYLFSTNGTLLTTFTNPTPAPTEGFGCCVTAVGSDRVLIGAYFSMRFVRPIEEAYLFSVNGTLITTFTDPTPGEDGGSGYSVAAVGSDQVVIGAPYWPTGAAYLYSLATQTPALPSLAIRLTSTNALAVSWPSAPIGWTLQQNTNGVASVNWSNAPGPIQDDGTTKTLIVTPSAENRFFRLVKP